MSFPMLMLREYTTANMNLSWGRTRTQKFRGQLFCWIFMHPVGPAQCRWNSPSLAEAGQPKKQNTEGPIRHLTKGVNRTLGPTAMCSIAGPLIIQSQVLPFARLGEQPCHD